MQPPRIRTVKPELFQHERLYDAEAACGLPLRLAFIALFTCCDREGRFAWLPRTLKARCTPFEDVDFEAVLDALHGSGFLHKYSVDGELYGCIPSWKRHQVINTREAQSRLPGPDAGVMEEPKPSRHIPRATQAHVRARDAAMCCTCGATQDLTFDHIVPFSKGGAHDLENLRILCRSCNSSKSDKDLAQVHGGARAQHARAQREGKGRDRNGSEGNGTEEPTGGTASLALAVEQVKPKRKAGPAKGAPAWDAYCAAYLERYPTEPVRNAKVNGQLAQLVDRLGADAPEVARWYVAHNDSQYIRAKHPVGLLLAHCEGLHTEWKMGRQVTAADARQAEATQNRLNVFGGFLTGQDTQHLLTGGNGNGVD